MNTFQKSINFTAAEKIIKKVDRQRNNYYKYVTGKNCGDRNGKHLMIDVSYYGIEGTAELVCKSSEQKFNFE